MGRLFAKQHLKVLSFDANTGMLAHIGSATLKVNNEVVDNTALLDDWKQKNYGAGEWSLDVEVAADSTCTKDFVKLAADKASIAVVLQVKYTTDGGITWSSVYINQGTVLVESAENVIEAAIRQRATFVGQSTLTVTLGD